MAYGRAVLLKWTSSGDSASSTAQVARTGSVVQDRASSGPTAINAMPATSIGRCIPHSVTPERSCSQRKYTVSGML